MNCSRCGEPGAERGEIRLKSDATVIVYLCAECAELEARDDEISEIAFSPSQ